MTSDNGEVSGGRSSRSSTIDWSCDEVEEFDALAINVKPKPVEKYPGLYDDSDQTEAFRQRRYFYYLSGMNLPDCVVAYNIQEDKLTAFIPPLNLGRSVLYIGQNPTPEEIKSKYDFDDVLLTSSLTKFLNQFAHKELGKIYVLHRSQAPTSLIAQNKKFWDDQEAAFPSASHYVATDSCRNCIVDKFRCYTQNSASQCSNCQRFGQECITTPAYAQPPAYNPPHAPAIPIPYRLIPVPVLECSDVQNTAVQAFSMLNADIPGNLHISPFEDTKLKSAMDASRVIKTPYELKMIRKASAISALGHTNVLRGIKYISNEAEIEAIFTATCIAEQAKQQSYGVIAASGENASTLHYTANNQPLKGRQLVCLDAGCDWECYASDVTRTFPISGKFSNEAQEIYNIVEQMQEECIDLCQPSANFREIHMHAHTVAAAGLIKLGILHNGTFEEIFTSGVTSAFFLHGLGHFMGLEVHDVGDGGNLLASKADEMLYGMHEKSWLAHFYEMLKDPTANSASILAPNQVVTVEPGIYFNRFALDLARENTYISKYINWTVLEKYYAVGGVRIEDDILITEDGYANLTTAPKGQAALDIINGEEDEAEVEEVAEVNVEKRKGWFW